jgi:pyruvyltransferase
MERLYKPKISLTKFKLGIILHYNDIKVHTIFPVFKNPNVLFIDNRKSVEQVINDIYSCENIISSSLHGIIICDSYNINHSLFATHETNFEIHTLQCSFKFKDYYSVFNQNFNGN